LKRAKKTLGLLLSLAVYTSVGCGEDPTVPPPTPGVYDDLHELMEDADRHYKFLNAHADSAEAQVLRGHTAALRNLFRQATDLEWQELEDAPPAERETLATAYQEHLAKIMPLLDQIDAAIDADDRPAVARAVEELHDLEERSHEALGVE
jgi:hypothetical protein